MNTKKKNLILSVETATRGGSLAILSGSSVCELWQGDPNSFQSSSLIPEIQNILNQTGVKIEEIDLLAVAIGPGSFTDLRIGLAIVRGLAAVREIPVIGVPTLEAMIFGESEIETSCALWSAGRGEYFAQTFRGRKNRIAEPMRIGQLKNILTDLKDGNTLRLVAPDEIWPDIFEFAVNEQIKNWKVVRPPENLAVCVGQGAFDLFRENKVNQSPSQLIYGREAVMIKK